MNEFIAKHREQISATLSGWDRLVFRGTLRNISYAEGMDKYRAINRVLLKDFGRHVQQVSERLKKAALAPALEQQRPVQYLASSHVDKEKLAREIAERDGIQQGLICVLNSLEPVSSFEVYRCREQKQLRLQKRQRKCAYLYFYWMDAQWGFMNARIATWFPFPIQVCLNGREWLTRQMDQAGMRYVRQDNCIVWSENWKQTQRLMDRQLKAAWPKLLDKLVGHLNPLHKQIFERFESNYYWTAYQTEWATDLVFREREDLKRLYGPLIYHGITTFSSQDVMRFLGRRMPLSGKIPLGFQAEVRSDVVRRQEGMRIKHRDQGNSVKLYDKAFTKMGNVLRAEATLQNETPFLSFRRAEGDSDGPLSWRSMRKGVADLYRRAEVSRQAVERYLDALASVEEQTPLEEVLKHLHTRPLWNGARVRALRPFAEDRALLEAVNRAEFTLHGLRNRDLQGLLFSAPPKTPSEARRRSAWVSRQLRMLRAHGILRKIAGTHRYQLTGSGRKAIGAILTALHSSIKQLTALAA